MTARQRHSIKASCASEVVQIELLHPHTGEPLLVRALEGEGRVARCKQGSAGAEALRGTSGVGMPVFDFPACATNEGAAVSRFSDPDKTFICVWNRELKTYVFTKEGLRRARASIARIRHFVRTCVCGRL